MRRAIEFSTVQREILVDITQQVERVVHDSVQTDVVDLLRKLIPRGVWLHDRQDGNGDAHLKAGLIGPSETVPIIDGSMGLSQWQNIFFCEFDGPRAQRKVICTILADAAD